MRARAPFRLCTRIMSASAAMRLKPSLPKCFSTVSSSTVLFERGNLRQQGLGVAQTAFAERGNQFERVIADFQLLSLNNRFQFSIMKLSASLRKWNLCERLVMVGGTLSYRCGENENRVRRRLFECFE